MSVADLKIPEAGRATPLRDVCDITKGNTPTMKAVPGEYPLVVTGATLRSSSEYQFDCEAVCIPLVSSTVHGHASIHRIHYQTGKFALANIMVALTPKSNAECNAKYLQLLLTARKDDLLVPLMAGTSNVSLRIPDLSAVEICLPPIAVQLAMVRSIESSFQQLELARTQRDFVLQCYDRLITALAHRDDLSDGQKQDQGWRKVKLGEVMYLDLDPVKVDPTAEYPNMGILNFAKGLFRKLPISGLETSATVLYRVKAGQFIFSRLFAFEGSYAYVSKDYDGVYVSGEYPTFTCDSTQCRAEFVYAHFRPSRVWKTLSEKSKGLGLRRQRVQPPAILAHEVWLPPLTEQIKIAEVLLARGRFEVLDTFEKDSESLRRSILSKAFRGEL